MEDAFKVLCYVFAFVFMALQLFFYSIDDSHMAVLMCGLVQLCCGILLGMWLAGRKRGH